VCAVAPPAETVTSAEPAAIEPSRVVNAADVEAPGASDATVFEP
jgi:hypothetical protein